MLALGSPAATIDRQTAIRDVSVEPIDFGAPGAPLVVPETASSSDTPTTDVPSWSSTSTEWSPIATDRSALTVRPAR